MDSQLCVIQFWILDFGFHGSVLDSGLKYTSLSYIFEDEYEHDDEDDLIKIEAQDSESVFCPLSSVIGLLCVVP